MNDDLSRQDQDSDAERRRDPGPGGKQYAADVEDARRRALLANGILIAMILLFCLNAYGTFIKNPADQKANDQEIRLSQYEGCVQGGNLLRSQIRDEFVDLKKKVLIPVFSQVAGTLPPTVPSRLILTDAVDYLHERIDTIGQRISNVHCRESYPPLDGQTFPDISPHP